MSNLDDRIAFGQYVLAVALLAVFVASLMLAAGVVLSFFGLAEWYTPILFASTIVVIGVFIALISDFLTWLFFKVYDAIAGFFGGGDE